jgi:hypothetical protein
MMSISYAQQTYSSFGEGLSLLKEIGLFDFFIPFLLVFAIIYGALEKTQVFGEGRHDINAVIALSIAFIFGITGWAVKATTSFLPWVGIIAVASVAFLMLTAMFWPDIQSLRENKWVKALAGGIMALIIVYLLLHYLGIIDWMTQQISEKGSIEEFLAVIVFLAIIFGGILMVIKGGGKK